MYVSSTHVERERCERCGASLNDGTPDGLCTLCLLKGAMETHEEDVALEALESPEKLAVRRELAGYELIHEIARGAMGVVFKARHRKLDRFVALKVIAAGELASPRMVERFHLETTAAARLDHPHIASIFEVGHEDSWHFFSMQLLEGCTLAEKLQGRPMEPKEAARILVKIARAVHHAHQRGVLHRDIKPTNIVFSSDGEPYLTDFGLAKLLETGASFTRSCAVLGTPAYMAPEQAQGDSKAATVLADVYSLGAIFYEMLAGAPPFHGQTTAEFLRNVLEREPAPPSSVLLKQTRKPLARELDTIVLGCLSKNPRKRYESAEALAEDIERWLSGRPIAAQPATALEKVGKWIWRNPAGAALAGTIATAVLVATIGAWVFNYKLHRANLAAEEEASRNLAQVIKRHLSEASSMAQNGEALNSLHSLAAGLKLAAEFPELQQSVAYRDSLTRAFSPRVERAWNAGGVPNLARFSADGKRVMVEVASRLPLIYDLISGEPIPVPETLHSLTVIGLVFDHEGSKAAILSEEAPFLFIWDFVNKKLSHLPLAAPGKALAFSPDGKIIATGGRAIQFWDSAFGRELDTKLELQSEIVFLKFAPDAKKILAIDSENQASLWNLETGKQIGGRINAGRFGDSPVPAFNARKSLVIIPDFSTAQFVDVESFELRQKFNLGGVLFQAACNADQSAFGLAAFGAGGEIRDAETLFVKGPRLSHDNGARCLAFSDDNELLATGGFDYQVRIWRQKDFKLAAPVLPHAALVTAVDFSNDSRNLVTAAADGLVRVWNIANDPINLVGTTGIGYAAHPNKQGGFLVASSTPNQLKLFRFGEESIAHNATIATSRRSVVAWTADAKQVATAAEGHPIRIWNPEDGQKISQIPTDDIVRGMGFSPDGKQIAVCGDEGSVKIYSTSGEVIRVIVSETDPFVSLAWSPNGKRIATGQKGKVQIWDSQSGRRISAATHFGTPLNLRFSHDSARLAACFADDKIEPQSAFLFDSANGALIAKLPHADGVRDVVFSPNSKLAVTLGEDNAARLWNTGNGTAAGPALRHAAMLRSASFSPDGHYLATGGGDHALRIWEVSTGELCAPPILFESSVSFLEYDPTGNYLIASIASGAIYRVETRDTPSDVRFLFEAAIISTAHHQHPSGGFMSVAPREIAEKAKTNIQYSNSFSAAAWHEQKAFSAEILGNWFGHLYHLKKLRNIVGNSTALESRIKRGEGMLLAEKVLAASN